MTNTNGDTYECSASLDPKIVRKSFNRFGPIWQSIDLAEFERLEEARRNYGPCNTTDFVVKQIRDLWPAGQHESGTYDYRYGMKSQKLTPNAFLPFFRKVEKVVIKMNEAAILAYWSRQTAARLLPGGTMYRELIRQSFCTSIFSEDRNDLFDEWAVLIESRSLCLIVYGQNGGAESVPLLAR